MPDGTKWRKSICSKRQCLNLRCELRELDIHVCWSDIVQCIYMIVWYCTETWESLLFTLLSYIAQSLKKNWYTLVLVWYCTVTWEKLVYTWLLDIAQWLGRAWYSRYCPMLHSDLRELGTHLCWSDIVQWLRRSWYIHDCLILHSDLGELDIHVIVLYCTVT